MGCDIHVYTEIRKTVDEKPKWFNNDYWQFNPYYDPKDPQGENKMDVKEIYHGRNYELFAILADVRNFGENKPMSEPRGLPKDVSKIVKSESKRWGEDGHSHSYFTLKELKDAQKLKTNVKRSGLITQEAAKKLDEGISKPDTWCQGASSELKLVYREWEEDYNPLDGLIKNIEKRVRDEFWIWDEESEISEAIQEDFRIVFWFDN